MIVLAPANDFRSQTSSAGGSTLFWFGECGPPILVGDAAACGNAMHPFQHSDLDTPFRQCGWIRLRETLNSVSIQFDLAAAPIGTFGTLLDFLDSQPPDDGKIIKLCYFWGGAWARERYDDWPNVISRVTSLIEWRNVTPTNTVILGPAIDPSAHSYAPTIKDLATSGRGAPNLPANARTCDYRLTERGLVLDRIGALSGLALIFGRDWASSAIGSLSVPDGAYDRAVSQPYFNVLDYPDRHTDRVTAAVSTSLGPEPLWLTYDRVILPSMGRKDCLTVLTGLARANQGPIPALSSMRG